MKTKHALLAAIIPAFMLIQFSAKAQENFMVKSSMRMEGLPPEMAAMGEGESTTYIKGDKVKSERTGMMGSTITYVIGDNITSLSDQMGNKTGFTATRTEMNAGDPAKNEKPKIEYTNEKKTICGYECTKAIVTSVKDKKEVKMNLWVTDKLVYKSKDLAKMDRNGMDLSDLRGYPLSMEMTMNMQGSDVTMKITATEVSTKAIDDSVFAINTEGYKMMTYKEMKERQKAGGPGMPR